VPDGSGFPCSMAVQHDHRGVIKTGVRVGAEGVGEVMIHEPYPRSGSAKVLTEAIRAAILMPHADEVTRGIEKIEIGYGPLTGGVEFQIVAIFRARCLPAKAHFVNLVRTDAREFEARLDCVQGEARIVFLPADALFRDRELEFAIAHETSGGIMQLRIVEAESDHAESASSATKSRANLTRDEWSVARFATPSKKDT